MPLHPPSLWPPYPCPSPSSLSFSDHHRTCVTSVTGTGLFLADHHTPPTATAAGSSPIAADQSTPSPSSRPPATLPPRRLELTHSARDRGLSAAVAASSPPLSSVLPPPPPPLPPAVTLLLMAPLPPPPPPPLPVHWLLLLPEDSSPGSGEGCQTLAPLGSEALPPTVYLIRKPVTCRGKKVWVLDQV